MQANESEIPLLHESNGTTKENGTSIEVKTFLFADNFTFLMNVSLCFSANNLHYEILGGKTSVIRGNDSR